MSRHTSSHHRAQAGLPGCKSVLPGTEQAELKGTLGQQTHGVAAAKNLWPQWLPGQCSEREAGLGGQSWLYRAKPLHVRAPLLEGRWKGCQDGTCQWCGQLVAKAKSESRHQGQAQTDSLGPHPGHQQPGLTPQRAAAGLVPQSGCQRRPLRPASTIPSAGTRLLKSPSLHVEGLPQGPQGSGWPKKSKGGRPRPGIQERAAGQQAAHGGGGRQVPWAERCHVALLPDLPIYKKPKVWIFVLSKTIRALCGVTKPGCMWPLRALSTSIFQYRLRAGCARHFGVRKRPLPARFLSSLPSPLPLPTTSQPGQHSLPRQL